MKNTSHPAPEGFIFLAINVGIPLILNTLQALSPTVFWNLPFALMVAGFMVLINLYRALRAKRHQWLYAAIIPLNMITLFLLGNVSFLTSLRGYYLAFTSLINA
ncbi:MAG: hypothetical protein ACPGVK_01280 [Halocynthiibacter sp.]